MRFLFSGCTSVRRINPCSPVDTINPLDVCTIVPAGAKSTATW